MNEKLRAISYIVVGISYNITAKICLFYILIITFVKKVIILTGSNYMTESTDILLERFFDVSLWQEAIEHGDEKYLNFSILREMCKPEVRVAICDAISNGRYRILPPHIATVPKDNGGRRTVYVNEDADRVILHIANNLLMDEFADMIHPSCLSYRKGLGCGKIVRDLAKECANIQRDIIGWKCDLSKYFDSVPMEVIDEIFDTLEERKGKSALVKMLREYYHSEEYIDKDKTVGRRYMSLRQGCSVASFLANVVLKDVDERLSSLDGSYVRYSDDMIFIGAEYEKALSLLEMGISDLGLKLNPDKFQYLHKGEWFNFLGFSIREGKVSLSPRRIKRFQHEIEHRTFRAKKTTVAQAVKRVLRYLYKGNGEFAWADQILPYLTERQDIDILNNFVMDCLRAVETGKRRVGGLGFDRYGEHGCIKRGKGRNTKSNREKTEKYLDSYKTINCMRNAMRCSHEVYETLVRII